MVHTVQKRTLEEIYKWSYHEILILVCVTLRGILQCVVIHNTDLTCSRRVIATLVNLPAPIVVSIPVRFERVLDLFTGLEFRTRGPHQTQKQNAVIDRFDKTALRSAKISRENTGVPAQHFDYIRSTMPSVYYIL